MSGKKPSGYRSKKRFGILNHLGGVWSPETFETEAAAQEYLDRQRATYPDWQLGRHKVVPVRVTVTPIEK